jgi:hypothetical protein
LSIIIIIITGLRFQKNIIGLFFFFCQKANEIDLLQSHWWWLCCIQFRETNKLNILMHFHLLQSIITHICYWNAILWWSGCLSQGSSTSSLVHAYGWDELIALALSYSPICAAFVYVSNS